MTKTGMHKEDWNQDERPAQGSLVYTWRTGAAHALGTAPEGPFFLSSLRHSLKILEEE